MPSLLKYCISKSVRDPKYIYIYLFTACAGEADIAFVLDASGSVSFTEWLKVIEFVHQVIIDLFISTEGVHVGIISFGDKTHKVMCFNE